MGDLLAAVHRSAPRRSPPAEGGGTLASVGRGPHRRRVRAFPCGSTNPTIRPYESRHRARAVADVIPDVNGIEPAPRRTAERHPQRAGPHLYVWSSNVMYTSRMDVAVTELRAHLSRWIDAAREGEDVVITDRGTPVARIVALDATPVIDRLTAQGVISRPTTSTRPVAGGRRRPSPRHPVAEIVSEQRR
jgi:prevent-host-death family protein